MPSIKDVAETNALRTAFFLCTAVEDVVFVAFQRSGSRHTFSIPEESHRFSVLRLNTVQRRRGKTGVCVSTQLCRRCRCLPIYLDDSDCKEAAVTRSLPATGLVLVAA